MGIADLGRDAARKVHGRLHSLAVRLGAREPSEQLRVLGRDLRVWHRASRADREAIAQNLLHEQYRFPFSRGGVVEALERFHDSIIAAGKRPLIIDAGAHIGSSAIWFALRYPGASIIAVEPDPGNAALLRRNTSDFGIEVWEAGLGSAPGTAAILDPGFGEWSYRTMPDAAGGVVKVVTMEQLLEGKPASRFVPFICKLDIEGAEQDLFEAAGADAFSAFPLIIIELHDWMLPGQGSSRSFLRLHLSAGRDLLQRGENLFSVDAHRLLAREPAGA